MSCVHQTYYKWLMFQQAMFQRLLFNRNGSRMVETTKTALRDFGAKVWCLTFAHSQRQFQAGEYHTVTTPLVNQPRDIHGQSMLKAIYPDDFHRLITLVNRSFIPAILDGSRYSWVLKAHRWETVFDVGNELIDSQKGHIVDNPEHVLSTSDWPGSFVIVICSELLSN